MTLEPSQFRYSITLETQDDVVLFCLRALWQYAEREPETMSVGFTSTGEWRSHNGQITFHFSNAHNRADFLGEATRLFAGKWTRLNASDDDPPQS